MTAWVWQKLRTPLTKRFLAIAAVLVLLTVVALHIEAALFAFRVKVVLTDLREVDAGQTSEKELLRLLPRLQRTQSVVSNCGHPGEAFEIEWDNFPTTAFGRKIFSAIHESKFLYGISYWLGLRPRRFYVSATTDHGVVIGWEYSVWVAPPENRYPGVIRVGVSSPISILRYTDSTIADEQNPEFSARRYFKWSEWDLEVSYSRLASKELKDYAFDLHLNCVWSLSGCRNATELLPKAEEERLRLRRAAMERIRRGEPCPPFIIPAKVRDANEVALLKVKSAQPKNYAPYDDVHAEPGLLVDYELVRTLELQRPDWGRVRLQGDWHPFKIHYGDAQGLDNPAIRLLSRGSTIVYFNGRGESGSPCNLMPTTADILSRVDEAITLKDWGYG